MQGAVVLRFGRLKMQQEQYEARLFFKNLVLLLFAWEKHQGFNSKTLLILGFSSAALLLLARVAFNACHQTHTYKAVGGLCLKCHRAGWGLPCQ